MGFFLDQIAIGPMANFAYVIGDQEAGVAVVVDPGWEAQQLLDAVAARNCSLQAVWLTHTHFDHVNSLAELCRLASPEKVYVHAAEQDAVPEIPVPVEITQDGSTLTIGAYRFSCLHTPGHSPGGQCFLYAEHCIAGDTLFVDGCGRVDLPHSDPEAMFHSLRRLAALPKDTIVYPGHGYGATPTSTIGEQLVTNHYLRAETLEAFWGERC